MLSACSRYQLPLKPNDDNGIKKWKMLYNIPRNIKDVEIKKKKGKEHSQTGTRLRAAVSHQNREAKITRRGLKRAKLRFYSCRVNSDN